MAKIKNRNKITLLSDRDLQNEICGPYVKYALTYHIPKNSTGVYRPYDYGLYDPHIFGFVDHCNCRGIKRTYYEGTKVKCPNCKCWVMSKDEYLEEFSLYRMNAPFASMLNINDVTIEFKRLFGHMPCGLPSNLKGLWSLYMYTDSTSFQLEIQNSDGETDIIDARQFYDRNGNEVWVAFGDLPGENEDDIPKVDNRGKPIDYTNMGLFGLKKLSTYVFPDGRECNIIGDLINYNLIITSPGRQSRKAGIVRLDNSNKLAIGKETLDYAAIINYNLQIKNYLENPYLSITDKATFCWYCNIMVNSHIATNEVLQSSKQSLARTNLDTRIFSSMRALIVADLDLPMDTVGLPETFVYGTLENYLISAIQDRLIEKAHDQGIDDDVPIQDAKKLYIDKDPFALQVFHEVVEASIDEDETEIIPCICKLVRNPSLHKWNNCSFKIKLVEGDAIHLPVAVDEGDQNFWFIRNVPKVL